jgi:hypothetical protein
VTPTLHYQVRIPAHDVDACVWTLSPADAAERFVRRVLAGVTANSRPLPPRVECHVQTLEASRVRRVVLVYALTTDPPINNTNMEAHPAMP